MLDHLITGATVVDGTGAPSFRGDVGIRDGRIVAVGPAGSITEDAATTEDATGLVLAPGFVDPHTHYDAQLHWDAYATPSANHGVTTIVGGNCGFTLAPLKAEDADYTRRMMAKVEGMALPALETGIDWSWETFAEFLDKLDGSIGVNAAFMAGHCAIRRYVMGPDSVGKEATPEQIAAMVAELKKAMEAGALGFSTGRASHTDGDGKPVPSRHATPEEVLALCAEVGRHEGTQLEVIVAGCNDEFSDEEIELLTQMTVTAGRPMNWNVLTVDSAAPTRVPRQIYASEKAAEAGGKIVILTLPVLVPMNMSLLTYCALNLMPGEWGPTLALPVAERIEKLRDKELQARLVAAATSPEAGVFRRLSDFGRYVIGDVYSEANAGLSGRQVADIAKERGQDDFETLVEICANDDLRTVLWPMPTDNDQASWDLRQETWTNEHVILGGSDAGAHLDRMCGATYTTRFLGDTLRGRKLVSLERAVQMLTSDPAKLFGLKDRGSITEGNYADLVLFDPETVNSGPARLMHDLPGDSPRLTAESEGIVSVRVNGVETIRDGQTVGALAGRILRSGKDTYTVTPESVSF
ncbi:N-acyl-D-amino-acid deacylase family protein [Yinghuangia seranimata]|uniref:N-acyl-D-amino-acid deacylase family protein n=1 Tax=Yinghuangia seranimata TaxID=408067 RepID=UPI00248C6438|nr:D-aminoacylase [Yinghuangia seranimata]MDI2130272.1 D-aminoacylase [Yinghuangia seranimata]